MRRVAVNKASSAKKMKIELVAKLYEMLLNSELQKVQPINEDNLYLTR